MATSAEARMTASRILATEELRPLAAEVTKRHDESIQRLQNWIRHPSIAAENRAMDEGCELMAQMAREAGFQQAKRIDTDGHPGVFATLDAGASKTFGIYFMYDVKQADPSEWSSPPFDAAIVDFVKNAGAGVQGRNQPAGIAPSDARDGRHQLQPRRECGSEARRRRRGAGARW